MAMHGFGTGSGSSPKRVKEIIDELLKVPGIFRAEWAYKKHGHCPDIDIVFEFGHSHEDWPIFIDKIAETGCHDFCLYVIRGPPEHSPE
ncbi:MAG: hypothetical protein PVH12_01140 [Candidatus Bathyarchaeota archaeon]